MEKSRWNIFIFSRAALADKKFKAQFDAAITASINDDQIQVIHYENLPMSYTDFSKVVKFENFQYKNVDIFLIFAQNIDCGYKLEPPRRGGSNEYPQSMFWSKNKKNRYPPAYPSIAI